MVVRFTSHARRRLAQRKLSEDWVESTIGEPDWQQPDPSDPRLVRAYKRLPQAGGRLLRVVYMPLGEGENLIITAFPDRDAKPPGKNHVR